MSVSQMLLKAAKLTKAGQADDAKEIYKSILDEFPNNEDAQKGLLELSRNPINVSGPTQAELNELKALYDAQKFQETVDFGRKLLTSYPNAYLVHYLMGSVHLKNGTYLPALVHFQKVVDINKDYAEGHHKLGVVYHNLRIPDKSLKAYETAIALNPKYTKSHSNRNLNLNYSNTHSPEEIYKKHIEFEAQFGGKANHMKLSPDIDTHRPLRVGYVSPDFRTHSVAYFFEPLLAAHDKTKIESFCYYSNTKSDDMTKRLQGHSDHWRDVSALDDAALARQIAADKIDILVDLAGHTAKSRIQMFARKPAPIQVAWLGYPNTTGLKAIDYRFTDKVADPVGDADAFHSEELIRLEGGMWCYTGGADVPMVTRSSGPITFGSFNNASKLSPDVIALWSDVLKSVPDSRLLLKYGQVGNAAIPESILQLFAAEGIGSDRLDLHNLLPKREDHLGLYGQVDIALDPFPFNGCTTTFEAMWMGVPVIALRGETHVGRVGASILTHLGTPELLADSKQDYIRIAKELAGDAQRRQEYRAGLRDMIKASPLGDTAGFAQKIEASYAEMWAKFVSEVDQS